MPKGDEGGCVVERRLAALSGRFRSEVLKELERGGKHFAALRRLTGASPHTLTRSLRSLESAGFVARSRPDRWGPCTYALTPSGQHAIRLLDALTNL